MNLRNRALALALTAVVLSACTATPDAADPGAAPASATEASESAGQLPTEDPIPTLVPTPTEEPTSTVVPATGVLLKVKGMEANLPLGWVATTSNSTLQRSGGPRTTAGTLVQMFRFPDLLLESVDDQARQNATRSDWDFKLNRLADVTIDGQVVTHLSGKTKPGEYVDLFATLRDGEEKELQFIFGGDESKAERDKIVQSVLASWYFTS